jgi:hypothetical protein
MVSRFIHVNESLCSFQKNKRVGVSSRLQMTKSFRPYPTSYCSHGTSACHEKYMSSLCYIAGIINLAQPPYTSFLDIYIYIVSDPDWYIYMYHILDTVQ